MFSRKLSSFFWLTWDGNGKKWANNYEGLREMGRKNNEIDRMWVEATGGWGREGRWGWWTS